MARKTAMPMTMQWENSARLQHQEFLFIETSAWDDDQSANSTAYGLAAIYRHA
jgi:hypothetical protein